MSDWREHRPRDVHPDQSQAIWALVLSIFGGCCLYIPTIAAIVMGFRVLKRSDEDRVDHGRGLAIAAVLVASTYVGLALATLSAFLGADAFDLASGHRAGRPMLADASRVEISDLVPRDCFTDPRLHGGRRDLTREVDCDRPHDAEVIDLLPVASLDYPGRPAFRHQARKCDESFEGYVGVPLAESELATSYFYPTPSSWSEPSTHMITCVAVDPTGRLRGSVWRSER
ncbi:DUF4190 domain-containing protein [Nocardioides sp. MH1]|uniref:DUF4190 domain-containing protein n=1 Tax=Nocardioides sp. MH1 TaxID=3242490 RepID=UPI003522AD31